MRKNFDKATQEINDAIQNLMECASLRKVGLSDYRNITQDRLMAQSIASSVASSISSFSDRSGGSNQSIFKDLSHNQKYQIPYSNADRFVGREEILSKIEATLKPGVTTQQNVFCIWGLGGVGKTQIALTFINRGTKLFDLCFWVKAENKVSLRRSFTDIAVSLDLPGVSRSNPPDDNRDTFISWLLLCRKLILGIHAIK